MEAEIYSDYPKKAKQHCRKMWNNPKATGTRRKEKDLFFFKKKKRRSLVFPYLVGYIYANEKLNYQNFLVI